VLLFAVQLAAQCCLPAKFCCRCGWLSSSGRALTGPNPTNLGTRPIRSEHPLRAAAIPRTLDYTGALLMPIHLRQAPCPSDLVPSGLLGPVRIMREE
jgi:hypothetical protein